MGFKLFLGGLSTLLLFLFLLLTLPNFKIFVRKLRGKRMFLILEGASLRKKLELVQVAPWLQPEVMKFFAPRSGVICPTVDALKENLSKCLPSLGLVSCVPLTLTILSLIFHLPRKLQQLYQQHHQQTLMLTYRYYPSINMKYMRSW